MKLLALILCVVLVDVYGYPTEDSETADHSIDERNYNFPFVTRAGWSARAPTGRTNLAVPVANVVIHHSFIPGACTTRDACAASMRSMQNSHMNSNGWADIGYNFAVGGDGSAYEGRGWNTVGAHSAGFNSASIGIVLIGDWRTQRPNAAQIRVTQQLIAAGVQMGFLRRDYRLMGHRQVVATECPGNALFNEIRTWPNFRSAMVYDDLTDLVEDLEQ